MDMMPSSTLTPTKLCRNSPNLTPVFSSLLKKIAGLKSHSLRCKQITHFGRILIKQSFFRYPPVENGLRFLNAGVFIGYADVLNRMLSSSVISVNDDDQLFITKIYLNETQRRQFNIKLDHRCAIFQNLNEALADIQLRFDGWHLQIIFVSK